MREGLRNILGGGDLFTIARSEVRKVVDAIHDRGEEYVTFPVNPDSRIMIGPVNKIAFNLEPTLQGEMEFTNFDIDSDFLYLFNQGKGGLFKIRMVE